MKSKYIILLISILFSLYSCNERQKGNVVKNANMLKELKISRPKSTILDTILSGNDRFNFSSIKLKGIANRSLYKVNMLYEKSKTLSLCCAGEHFSKIFGSLDKDSLLTRYKFFKYKKEKYKSFSETYKVTKYFYRNSFIKTFFYKHSNSIEIACAKITDKDIRLKNDIRVGISEKNFLKLLFDNNDIEYLAKFDTVNIADDETGEINYLYIFKNNILKEFIIDTSNDWLDKEIK